MRFRKKPVVIEAWRVQSDMGGCPKWFTDELGKSVRAATGARCFGSGGMAIWFINTLEGEMRADPGDWIIRGVKGELYPCKPDIFAETYEQVAEG